MAGPDPSAIAHGLSSRASRHGERAPGRRDPRRNRHAARDLPPLGADAAPARRRDRGDQAADRPFERVDVVIAMSLAGIVNISMLVTAAAVFHSRGLTAIGADLGRYTARSGPTSGPVPAFSSGSRCSPPASRRRASGRSPARSSCRASSTGGSRSSCAASSRWSRR